VSAAAVVDALRLRYYRPLLPLRRIVNRGRTISRRSATPGSLLTCNFDVGETSEKSAGTRIESVPQVFSLQKPRLAESRARADGGVY
jgi:hypothetical protein